MSAVGDASLPRRAHAGGGARTGRHDVPRHRRAPIAFAPADSGAGGERLAQAFNLDPDVALRGLDLVPASRA